MTPYVKASRLGLRTLRNAPRNADDRVHAWLLRAGYLLQHAAGIFCFSPLVYRVERKVSDLVAEEITRFGGAEMRLPILQNAEVWRQTGRWEVYEREQLMFQLKDRRERDFGLSPTAEEAVCDYANQFVASVSQLPLILFQQNFKFRDELRPRSGLLRSREFIMMDAYSFDLDQDGLDRSYGEMRRAYHAVMSRLGLDYLVVQADSGAIGGSASEEFMSVSDLGEDTILFNDGYAANLERAVSTAPTGAAATAPDEPMTIVATPDATTIEAIAAQLDVPVEATLKTLVLDLVFADRNEPCIALIRGDGEINLVKLANRFGAIGARPAARETVVELMGCEPGYVGPVDMPGGAVPEGARYVADLTLEGATSLVSGCNRAGHHALGARAGRDFPEPDYADIRSAREGELAPNGEPLRACRGVEVGHIFKLGDKYSKAMNAGVDDRDQSRTPFQMGCYGIGTTRLIAAIADQGMKGGDTAVWPLAVAPFHVHVVPLRQEHMAAAEALADGLAARDVECLLDDRGGSAGSLLKDSDLLGIPMRVVLGRKTAEGIYEFLDRSAGEPEEVEAGTIADRIAELIEREREKVSERREKALAGLGEG